MMHEVIEDVFAQDEPARLGKEDVAARFERPLLLEMRVGRRWYLNPSVDLVQHDYNGQGTDHYRERLVTFGMSILYQSGR